ncbi:hypothetical protein D3C81_1196420 [compost metagenome]
MDAFIHTNRYMLTRSAAGCLQLPGHRRRTLRQLQVSNLHFAVDYSYAVRHHPGQFQHRLMKLPFRQRLPDIVRKAPLVKLPPGQFNSFNGMQ